MTGGQPATGATSPVQPHADRATVLAWIRETGRGYKAASRQFGIPRSTIQSWVLEERRGKPERPARAQARAREPDPAPEPVDDEEPWDPADCDRETWLRRGMVRAMERSRIELLRNHGGNAVRWEVQAAKYRNELDELLEAKALAGLVPKEVDLVSLSRELAELIPSLVRMDPERWAAVVEQIRVEVAKYQGGGG